MKGERVSGEASLLLSFLCSPQTYIAYRFELRHRTFETNSLYLPDICLSLQPLYLNQIRSHFDNNMRYPLGNLHKIIHCDLPYANEAP